MGFNSGFKGLMHACESNRLPAATFVNYVYTLKITQECRQLDIPIIATSARAAREPARNNGSPLP